MIVLLSLIICLLATVLFWTIYKSKQDLKKAYDEIEYVLDDLLKGNYDNRKKSLSESRGSKIAHKVTKIMDRLTLVATENNDNHETLQKFISEMSHQIKTPLASILMFSQLLMEDETISGESLDFIKRMKESSLKLQWLMDNLIKMSRLEIDAIKITPIYTCLNTTVRRAIDDVSADTLLLKKEIVVSMEKDLFIKHDPKWTVEVFANLLDNAIKYSDVGTKIYVSTESTPSYQIIQIKNTSSSFDSREIPQIYQRFYRGHLVSEKDGMGLGLYLARLILEKQRGYLVAESKNIDVIFSVYLQKRNV